MAWRKRPSRGALPLVIMMITVSIWALFQALAFVAEDIDVKLFLSNMRYFGIEVAPLCFYVVAYEYSDELRNFSLKRWLLYLTLPFIFIVSLWTNHLHHQFYLSIKLENSILILENGPLFWINMMYLYSYIVLGVYMAIRAYMFSSSIYRIQSLIIALAALVPTLANLAFNFGFLPFENIDITPISLLVSGVLFFYALFQHKLLELIPIARNKLIEDMDDIVIVVDNRKRILDLNKKAKDLILKDNFKSNNYIGREISMLLADWDELLNIILDCKESSERIIYNSVNDKRYFYVKISDIYDKRKNVSGKFIVLRDITQLEKALIETEHAKLAAEQANQSKGYFLANMSHEIRTPMNAIIGITEILETNDLPRDEQKRYIQMISKSADSLLTILNDILDFSKIDAGKMEIEKSDFDLVKLLNEIVETFNISAHNKSIEVSSAIDRDLTNLYIGDAVRLRQILTNLIGNALKFTHEGSVEVIAEKIKKENNLVYVGITVKDTGIGIAKEKLDKIFEGFKQADSSTTRKYGGTGLGLSIAKNLIELMGGTIRVESEVAKGSSFIINLPLEIYNKEVHNDNSQEDKQNKTLNLSGLKILIADDNKINREVINLYLKKTECELSFAENGAIALQLYENNVYDLVFMDIQMPEMDGLEVTRRIREIEKISGGHIPIIALTAGAMKSDVDNCFAAGMDAHVSKPLKAEKLFKVLENYSSTK
jgi:signal transduction histidine kinase/CheY-like chemotaxis protein